MTAPGDSTTETRSAAAAERPRLAVSPLSRQVAMPVTEGIRAHPSSPRRKLGKRYIGVSPVQDVKLPLPWGAPRQRLLGGRREGTRDMNAYWRMVNRDEGNVAGPSMAQREREMNEIMEEEFQQQQQQQQGAQTVGDAADSASVGSQQAV